ncbi:MAG: AAA-like domain-containing protein [Cyanobacteria bacterium P01_D01_bin.50]
MRNYQSIYKDKSNQIAQLQPLSCNVLNDTLVTATHDGLFRQKPQSLEKIPLAEIKFPNTPVPLNSPLYIERPPVEELAIKEIHKPGCVIRIKAPKKMGKSSLLYRIIAYTQGRDYKTVCIDFQEADNIILALHNVGRG